MVDTSKTPSAIYPNAQPVDKGDIRIWMTEILADLTGVRIGRFDQLTGVSGTSTAYTATAPAGFVDAPGAGVIFTPHVTNTTGAPTLSINGGIDRPLGEAGTDALGPERVIAGYPYLLVRTAAGAWRMVTDKWLKERLLEEEKRRASDDDLLNQWSAIQSSQWANPLTEGGRDDDPIYLLGPSQSRYWIASNGDAGQIVTVANNQFIDARFMKRGAAEPLIVHTYAGSSATVITESGNHLIGGNAFVRVYRDATGGYQFDAVAGSVSPAGAETTPVCDHTIIMGGQSLAARFVLGASLYGFQRGWQEFAGSGTTKFWFQNGAVGGSGLTEVSNPVNFWWDSRTGQPGPNALAWKAALDAIPAGQPKPSAIIWIFGQTDAGAITSIGYPEYRNRLRLVLQWMQDQISTTVKTPVIITPVGAWDHPYDKGAMGVRSAEFELVAEQASFHLGPAYFDLPRPWDDVHHGVSGQKLLGYRMAAAVDNVVNGKSNRQGPEVTAVEELDGGRAYRLTITPQPGIEFTRPRWVEGIAVYQAGANPVLNSNIAIKRQTWAAGTAGKWTLTLELGLPWPGATVVFPFGACTWARRGLWPMNVRNDPSQLGYGNVWPLKPFRLTATA